MKGVCGKILIVDVGTRKWSVKTLEDDFYQNYLSGVGLAVVQLHEMIPVGADPMGPENVLGFTSGVLTGSGAFFSGRWLAVTKSPLTGTWGEANGGGDFSPAIKRCGYDAIFVRGTSESPVFLEIDENDVKFHDGCDVWGKDVEETEVFLKTLFDEEEKISTVVIGEAGENLSLMAGIVNDSARMAARAGVGAVMGSKRLKAIVLNGALALQDSADVKQVQRLNRIASRYVWTAGPLLPAFVLTLSGFLFKYRWGRAITNKFMSVLGSIIVPTVYRKWGTVGLNKMSMHWGDAPAKNWQGSYQDFKGRSLAAIAPDKILSAQVDPYYCYSCPLGCGGTCSVTGYRSKKMHKPEFETVMSLGPLLMIDDMDFLFELNHRMNMVGMDTISTGGTIAFAMECFENGLIGLEETGGLDLQWGNKEAVAALIEQMIRKEGFGAVLADGSRIAARKIGKLSENYAIHAGGQEMSMHDPRLDPGFGLHASVDPNPGKHTTGSYLFYHFFRLHTQLNDVPKVPFVNDPDETLATSEANAKKSVLVSEYTQLLNASGVCLFGAFFGSDRLRVFDYLNAVTGCEMTPEDYMQIGHRIQTLKQLFNIREGIDPWENRMNVRLAGQPAMKDGPNKGRAFDIDGLMRNYWKAIGWDERTGVPLDETTRDLGITDYTQCKD